MCTKENIACPVSRERCVCIRNGSKTRTVSFVDRRECCARWVGRGRIQDLFRLRWGEIQDEVWGADDSEFGRGRRLGADSGPVVAVSLRTRSATCDVRRATCDVRRATCDVRRVTCDV